MEVTLPLHNIPTGLPDWRSTRKCLRAHRTPAEGKLDGQLHRPHQAV